MPKVLIVDDEAAVRRLFSRILSEEGVEVHVAEDGLRAIQMLRDLDEPFDAIVTDIGMPYVDGIELLKQIRTIDPDVPVVLITGMPQLDTAMRAVQLGAFRYLEKPVDRAALVKEVLYAARVGQLAKAKRRAQTHLGRASAAPIDEAGAIAAFEFAMESMWMAYQPLVSLKNREVVAYEALLRFESLAFRGPLDLLKAAEELDKLEVVGRRVRALVASDFEVLADGVDLFVNLHPIELLDPHLLKGPLIDWADRVVLEVTERQSLHGDVSVMLAALREAGFRIAVDDLGAGYSGLSSFAALRPDVVKLDMSLCRGIDKEPVLQSVVRSIVALCKEFGTTTVAEGIETPAELRAVASLGVDLLQGYLFARPQSGFVTVDQAIWDALG